MVTLPLPLKDKISVGKAIGVGWLWVNLPVLALIFGVPAIIFWLASQMDISSWLPLMSLALGIGLAWLWWSLAVPRWRLWAIRRVNNLYLLQQGAIRAQLVWPHGSIYENTEIKSPLHVLQEKHVQIHHYFDKFRYYLDYLETTGSSFHGLPETRQDLDAFRDALYYCDKNPIFKSTLKVSIDQLRYTLKSVRLAMRDERWSKLVDGLLYLLNDYQESSGKFL